jgi:hypothetical protein
MTDMIIRTSLPQDAHWGYDDPSGVPDGPYEVSLPGAFRDEVEHAAASAGVTPAQWLMSLVARNLYPHAA